MDNYGRYLGPIWTRLVAITRQPRLRRRVLHRTGKRIRHVKVRSAEMGQDSRVAEIVRAEIEALAAS